jgi:hypothetical protein
LQADCFKGQCEGKPGNVLVKKYSRYLGKVLTN